MSNVSEVTSNVPNLDSMSIDELNVFFNTYRNADRQTARKLVPDGRKGYTVIAHNLALYANYKSAAIKFRLAGQIKDANDYENLCDGIYNRLPVSLKW